MPPKTRSGQQPAQGSKTSSKKKGPEQPSVSTAEEALEDDVRSVASYARIEHDTVPILSSGAPESSVEPPEWVNALFPHGLANFEFPVGQPKNGKLAPTHYDAIGNRLRDRATLEGPAYRAFGHEWATLRPSIVYDIVCAQAVRQVSTFLQTQDDIATILEGSNFFQRLEQLEGIIVTQIDDKLKRASVIIGAATANLGTATRIAASFDAEATGVHPAAMAILKDATKTPTEGFRRKDFTERQEKRDAERGRGRGRGRGRTTYYSPSKGPSTPRPTGSK